MSLSDLLAPTEDLEWKPDTIPSSSHPATTTSTPSPDADRTYVPPELSVTEQDLLTTIQSDVRLTDASLTFTAEELFESPQKTAYVLGQAALSELSRQAEMLNISQSASDAYPEALQGLRQAQTLHVTEVRQQTRTYLEKLSSGDFLQKEIQGLKTEAIKKAIAYLISRLPSFAPPKNPPFDKKLILTAAQKEMAAEALLKLLEHSVLLSVYGGIAQKEIQEAIDLVEELYGMFLEERRRSQERREDLEYIARVTLNYF